MISRRAIVKPLSTYMHGPIEKTLAAHFHDVQIKLITPYESKSNQLYFSINTISP